MKNSELQLSLSKTSKFRDFSPLNLHLTNPPAEQEEEREGRRKRKQREQKRRKKCGSMCFSDLLSSNSTTETLKCFWDHRGTVV
jgi:hypothetical protein